MYRKLYTKHNSLNSTDSVKLNTTQFIFRVRNHSLPSNLHIILKSKAYDSIRFH